MWPAACRRRGGVSGRQESASPSRPISMRNGPAPSAATMQLAAWLGLRLGLGLGLRLGRPKTVPEAWWARRSEPAGSCGPASVQASLGLGSGPASSSWGSKAKAGRGSCISCGSMYGPKTPPISTPPLPACWRAAAEA